MINKIDLSVAEAKSFARVKVKLRYFYPVGVYTQSGFSVLYRCITDLNLQLNTEIFFIVTSIQFIVSNVFRNNWGILEVSILGSLLKILYTACN